MEKREATEQNKLVLSGRNLQLEREQLGLERVIRTSHNITILHLENCRITAGLMHKIGTLLLGAPNIVELNLRGNEITEVPPLVTPASPPPQPIQPQSASGSPGMTPVVVLEPPPQPKQYSAAGVLIISQLMMRQLKSLSLESTGIGISTSMFGPIVDALLKSTKLERLNLSSNNLSSEYCTQIAQALRGNHYIKKLILFRNTQCGLIGAQAFAKAIEYHKSLVKLDVESCGIPEMGTKSLAASLSKNNVLTTVHFDINKWSLEGLSVLQETLTTNTTLRELSLRYCNLASVPRFDEVLCHIIETNYGIKNLVLSANEFTVEQVMKISDSTYYNTTLKNLNINEQKDMRNIKKKDPSRLESNYSLTKYVASSFEMDDASKEFLERNKRLETQGQTQISGDEVLSFNNPSNWINSLQGLQGTSPKEVVVKRCRVQEIPHWIPVWFAESMTKLDFSNNELTSIVENIKICKNLKMLWLAQNKIQRVGEDLAQLPHLDELDLRYNPLEEQPESYHFTHEVVKGEKLRNILKGIEDYSKNTYETKNVKVMFVGEGNVGKSSLVRAFGSKRTKFPISIRGGSSSTELTDGIEITPLVVGKAIFDCWDFAGQELYYVTHQFFLTNNSVCLIVFNVKNPNYEKIDYWVNSLLSVRVKEDDALKRNSQWKMALVFVGTHMDDKKCKQEYLDEVYNKIFNRYKGTPGYQGISFVSTKTGKNVKELKEEVYHMCGKIHLLKLEWPLSYKALRDRMLALRDQGVRYIPYSMYKSEVLQCQITGEKFGRAQADSITEHLHDTGVLCFFGKDQITKSNRKKLAGKEEKEEALASWVITDPSFLSDVMSAVVSLKSQYVSNGRFAEKNVTEMFKPLFPNPQQRNQSVYDFILSLLGHFDLIFRFKGGEIAYERSLSGAPNAYKSTTVQGDTFLVPSMLPEITPQKRREMWPPPKPGTGLLIEASNPLLAAGKGKTTMERGLKEWIEQYWRVWEFRFIPLGLFSRLIVRLLNQSHAAFKVVCYFRNDVFVEAPQHGERAWLRLDMSLLQIQLQIRVDHNKIKQQSIRPGAKKRFGLLRSMVEVVETLLKSWYEGVEWTCYVPCTAHCIAKSYLEVSNPEAVTIENRSYYHRWILKDVQSAMVAENSLLSTIRCPKTSSHSSNSLVELTDSSGVEVPIRALAPDIAFTDFDPAFIVEPDELKLGRELGQGGFGTVYEGRLKRKTPDERAIYELEQQVQTALNNNNNSATNTQGECPNGSNNSAMNNKGEQPATSENNRKPNAFGPNGEIKTENAVQLQASDGDQVAVKQLSVVSLSESIGEFQNEAWMMSLLSEHPNLVQLKGVCMRPPMMILEFLPGGDLRKLLEQHAPGRDPTRSWLLRLSLALDTATGMSFMHSQMPPLIHRDLKTPNILVTKDLRAKVADFGTASVIAADLKSSPVQNRLWLAPEIISNKGYTTAADVYAFGVVMWELWTSEIPFDEYRMTVRSKLDLGNKIVEGMRPTVPPFQPNDYIATAYSDLMQSSWSGDPGLRPTFSQCEAKLKELYTIWQNDEEGQRNEKLGLGTPIWIPQVDDDPNLSASANHNHKAGRGVVGLGVSGGYGIGGGFIGTVKEAGKGGVDSVVGGGVPVTHIHKEEGTGEGEGGDTLGDTLGAPVSTGVVISKKEKKAMKEREERRRKAEKISAKMIKKLDAKKTGK